MDTIATKALRKYTKKITVTELRKRFSTPVSPALSARQIGAYCVGGALGLAIEGACAPHLDRRPLFYPFPDADQLAWYLTMVNPAFGNIRPARRYACEIIAHNDAAFFDEAWAALDRALTYTGRRK
jgi:hypothetical protein